MVETKNDIVVEKALQGNGVIVGACGSGKTYTVRKILDSLSRLGDEVTVIDVDRISEYNGEGNVNTFSENLYQIVEELENISTGENIKHFIIDEEIRLTMLIEEKGVELYKRYIKAIKNILDNKESNTLIVSSIAPTDNFVFGLDDFDWVIVTGEVMEKGWDVELEEYIKENYEERMKIDDIVIKDKKGIAKYKN